MEEHLNKRPNNFDGFSYHITNPADIEKLDPSAAILLEPGQIAFIQNYPKSLEKLIQKAAQLTQIPNFPKWLASLWNKPLSLELHTSSDIYDMSAVWLRFQVQEGDKAKDVVSWQPAINLLSYRNLHQIQLPERLSQVLNITGEINHNGYGVAGRLHHPDQVGDEVTFYETLYNDKAFYQLPQMDIFWEFHGGLYSSQEERREFGLYFFEQGLADFLNRYFGSLLENKEFRISREDISAG
jgi:hypothetical protein